MRFRSAFLALVTSRHELREGDSGVAPVTWQTGAMIGDAVPDGLRDMFAEFGRRPLGAAVLVGNREAVAQSTALRLAAVNLLDKAAAAYARGNDEKLQHFVNRLCALPFDEREDLAPGVAYAGHHVFTVLDDFLDKLADLDDEVVWLECVQVVWDDASDLGRTVLGQELAGFSYEASWRFRWEGVREKVAEMAAERDVSRPARVPEAEQADYIVECLRVAADLESSLRYATDMLIQELDDEAAFQAEAALDDEADDQP